MQIITNGKVTAKIDEQGAELRSLVIDGKEICWQADPAYWGKTSPFLFPMVGCTKNNQTAIYGKIYPLGRHGFARDLAWTAESFSNSAVFSLAQSDKTLSVYPYRFKLALAYRLLDNGVKLTYNVKNDSDDTMPYCIGAHPAFNCPLEQNGKFSDCKIVFEQAETVNSPVLDMSDGLWDGGNRVPRLFNEREFVLRHDLFDGDCVYFDTIKSRSALLTSDGTHGVKVSWTGFTTLGVWTPDHKNAPFVCIEPWKGTNDYKDEITEAGVSAFENKRDVELLPGGASREYAMTIELV
ncbi:galactose mutarotase [Clostridia bacterium]|nr:galactose mutarotase [Clostridia bacterium]